MPPSTDTAPSRAAIERCSDPALATTIVGVPAGTPDYWLDALVRCGLGWADLDAGLGSVALIPKEARWTGEQIRDLHQREVPIVGTAAVAAALAGAEVRTIRVEGLTGTGCLFPERDTIRCPAGLDTADGALARIGPEGSTPWIALPLPTGAEALAAAPALQAFRITDRIDVHEIASGCDHGGLRRILDQALRAVAEGPHRRLAHHPRGHSGCLALRIDADDFDPEATAAVADSLDRAGLTATWFIDVERHERKGGDRAVRDLAARGHEIQSHFFHHYSYRSAKRNRTNLHRARSVLASWQVQATAAAAPFGTFHAGMRRALEAEEIAWSSEFSAAYDDNPTWLHGVPQVPVHPVCPILLLQAGLDQDGVHRYFVDRFEANLRQGEPSLFYGHPIRDLAAVPGLFDALRQVADRWQQAAGEPVWQPQMSTYCEFHQARRDHLLGGATTAPFTTVDHAPGDRQAIARSADSCAPWSDPDRTTLRRRERVLRFRRWLRETRRR